MAPDLNGVSRTQQETSASAQESPDRSRRTSSVMGPPPAPQNSSLPSSPRPLIPAAMEGTSISSPPGPIRHPRPLTAAELHLELEKEQESIVNRLTRELSALRAQTASVASTASSTSDLFTSNASESYLYPYQSGGSSIIPTSARRHRSSSNLSSRSARSTREGLHNSASVGAGATSVSGVAAPRDRDRDRDRDSTHIHQTASGSGRPSIDIPRPEISRQNSTSSYSHGGGPPSYHRTVSSSNTNAATSPHWTSNPSQQQGIQHQTPREYHYPSSNRHSVSSNISTAGLGVGQQFDPSNNPSSATRSPSASASALAAARYEEAALQRAELESVKKENEALKKRIRELERSLNSGPVSTASAGAGEVAGV